MDFLLSRGDDLAALGVHLDGFELSADDGGTTATATGPAVIVLVLPPQHVHEDTVADASDPALTVTAYLSGPSRLAFDVATGTAVPLTPEGVLAACTALRAGGPALIDTWIEMPWRLALAPGAGTSHHPSTPLASPGRVTGVWLARLLSRAGGPMPVVPLDRSYAADRDFVIAPPLSPDQRTKVADLTAGSPAHATRWELTPLGGSITATGEWDGFGWSHRVTHGRDQYVRVEERVLLYPFGLSGTLTTLTERQHDVGRSAALRRTVTLRLNQAVVDSPDGGALRRTFPFERVEVGAAVFPGLGTPEAVYQPQRVTADIAELERQRDALDDTVTAEESLWRPYVDDQLRTDDDLRRANDPVYGSWWQADQDSAAKNSEKATLEESQRSYDDWIDKEQGHLDRAREHDERALLPDGTYDQGELDAAHEEELAAADCRAEAQQYFVDQGYLARVRREAADLAARAAQLRPEVDARHTARTVDDAVNLGDESPGIADAAARWKDDHPALEALRQQVDDLTRLSVPTTVTAWPVTSTGERLRFPVRLVRGGSVVEVSMPMLLVYDVVLPEAPAYSLPEYRSLADPALPGELDLAWAGPAGGLPELDRPASPPSVVDTGGVLLDLVGAAVPKAADSQLVRTLNLVGGTSLATLFDVGLGRVGGEAGRWGMVVDLPELTQLAGGRARATAQAVVGFTQSFLDQGEQAVAFLEAPAGIVADFTKAADRSGGLAALDVAADVISREHGPATLAGLLTHPSPADLIGEAATLLGFRLRDLIQTAVATLSPPPDPPRIVSELVDGVTPVVTMDWAVPLNDVEFFRVSHDPAAPTALTIHVVARPDGVVTDCRVEDFALQFPATDDTRLVRLDFERLRFLQQTTYGVDVVPGAGLGAGLVDPTLDVDGHVATHPPKVALDGFHLTFYRELELLAQLQEAVDLGGKVPTIKAGPSGVTAAYSLPVPDVGCGAFALSNLTFHSSVDIPFDGRPVEVGIGFATRDRPFSLSVLSFTGGGYVDVRLGAGGPQIEAALEFGAQVSVDFVVARGEVHALGGVQYVQDGTMVSLSGYLRIGGSVSVLELVSVSIELRIALAYQFDRHRLVGRATLVLEIDLTLWSDKIEIDSGEWVLQGGTSAGAAPESVGASPGSLLDPDEAFAAVDAPVTDDELAAWQAYRSGTVGAGR